MKNFMLISQGVDVNPLLLAIRRRPELWKEDTYLRDYPQGPFGEIESIILRFSELRGRDQAAEIEKNKRGEGGFDQHENVDTAAYKTLHEARPLVMSLMNYAGGERLGRVIINKIMPGGKIHPHVDSFDHATYWDRFHIVLQSGPGVLFRCGDETVRMATGEVWWFQNLVEHEVINNSADERIHLVVDIRTSK